MEVYDKMDINNFSDKNRQFESRPKTDRWGGKRAKLFLVVTGSFIIATVIVLIVVVYQAERPKSHYISYGDKDACPDLTIIGGGLAGSYIAWMLRNTMKTVHLYEMAENFGGRLLLNKRKEEMKIANCILDNLSLSKSNLKYSKLLKHFDLKPEIIKRNRVFYFLRNSLKTEKQRNNSHLPYFVDDKEKGLNPDNLRKFYAESIIGHKINKSQINNLCSLEDADKEILLKAEFVNGLRGYASSDGLNCLNDIWADNAPDLMSSLGYLLEDLEHDFSNCINADRLENLAARLLTEANKTYYFNIHLDSIEKTNGIFRLKFSVTKTENGELKRHSLTHSSCTKKLILAIPKSSLADIKWSNSFKYDNYKLAMQSLKTSKRTQIILRYNESWWPDSLTIVKTDLPAQKITFIRLKDEKDEHNQNGSSSTRHTSGKRERTTSFLLVIDSNDRYYDYWKTLESGKLVVNRLTKFFARILAKREDSIPDPETYSISYFKEAFPYYSHKFFWKKNFDWCNVRKKMLKPIHDQDVYIANDSFDTVKNQGKFETLLDNSDEILEKYFADYVTLKN
ncbi:DgyrCDS4870 [Dimorphilus gyrociliatus]|uniref:DgyrCDS4870 n=1 Tax=Dimorphilus gyrociliatus TaxID=2664684 RepID=A0A7I8VIS2_9ANNE|nr:DgyrCDS4870 [Dimorphilus gyrociliatus]